MKCTPSKQVVKVLAAAVKRASRLEFGFVGTENLLIALADTIGPGRRLGVKSVRAQAMARGVDNWAGDDGGSGDPGPDVTALMRAAHDHVLVEPALPASRALDGCLRAAIAAAGDGVLTTTHLSVALLSLESGRAADLFTVLRVDVDATTAAVRKAAQPEEAPAVYLLRRAGALEGDSGGGYVRWLIRFVARGQGLGGPVLTVVRNEATRLAVAAGRQEATAADLVAAVLTVDHQLTVAGRRLRPEFESGGAAALRAAGVDPATLPAATGAGVERFVEGAKLVAAQRGDEVVSTSHLLVAVREDLLDPVGRVLRGLAVET
ncbi:Clp protease N-terminal domain-containing protein [Lentzea sp. BCCO 10_0856]|uniref:Clp protease N-terminal domain-containing protein n=1 Tax=Lentzea miocenica TaxID=3095431 RepID=A0ABU4TG77_9PSEU|nr:Clp protease N-terminal domain-containing protein [Lentzea sp. BCCO 10_0856]MDX8037189.1 Clp protease N-terminal domain-containing protein [Lentzea sp. BCCO 10_0856]